MQIPAEFELARGLPRPGCSLAESEKYTRWLATHHYENFNVVSWLLPRRLHQHFYNLYAYCRWADDLGDEISDPAIAVKLLDDWEQELRNCYAGRASHPVFVALWPTIQACEIPLEPFSDLLVAFRQDQTVHRYPDWNSVLGYCGYSANPVGRLVLYLCGYRDAERQQLASLYAVGATLWRVPITHFSTWDLNWGSSPPAGAGAPSAPPPIGGDPGAGPGGCQQPLVHRRSQMKRPPAHAGGRLAWSEPLSLVAGTGFEPATSGL